MNVADLIGIHGSDANPHLWYDVPALDTVAAGIERALAQSDPAHRRDYAAGRRRFVQRLRPVERVLRRIDRRAASTPIAFTEPVPEYLTQAAGLRNLAPQSFTHPIAQGSEPPAAAVAEMTDLVAKRRVRVLLYNKQAVSPVTARVRAAAQRAGVPVIAVTETLPRGASFQGWMLGAVPRARRSARRMTGPVVSVEQLALRFGDRELWHGLSFERRARRVPRRARPERRGQDVAAPHPARPAGAE